MCCVYIHVCNISVLLTSILNNSLSSLYFHLVFLLIMVMVLNMEKKNYKNIIITSYLSILNFTG